MYTCICKHTQTHQRTLAHTAADDAESERERGGGGGGGDHDFAVDNTAPQEVCSLYRMCSHMECVRYMCTIV